MALEQETDAIVRVLTAKTIGEQTSCRFDALSAAEVPQGIRNFFRAEIRRRLEADLAKSSWFTAIRQSGAGSARVAQALIVSLTDAFEFSREDFLDTLDLAVHFAGNYLCRPQWTLVNFLFDRAPRISVAALSEGLGWVADYRYLGELATRTLRHRGQEEISRDDFQVLVARIDEEVIRQHDARELAALTRPLFNFFRIANTPPDDAIPVDALQTFFDEKKLHLLKEYIRGICHLRNKGRISLGELTPLIEDVFAGRTATTTAQAAEPIRLSPAPAPEAGHAPEPPPPRNPAVGPRGQNVALSLTFAGLKGNLVPPGPLPALNTLIQLEQHDRFVLNVFKGDAAHYAGALVMLDSLQTWEEAEFYLEELCRTNHLDPGEPNVSELVDTVRRRYASTERMP